MEIFKEKRATNAFHDDADFRVQKAEKSEDKITADLRRMHININTIMDELEEAQRNGTQQGATQGQTSLSSHSISAANSSTFGNFINAQIR